MIIFPAKSCGNRKFLQFQNIWKIQHYKQSSSQQHLNV